MGCQPTDAEVKEAFDATLELCAECGNSAEQASRTRLGNKSFCGPDCQDNYEWRVDLHQRAQMLIDAAYASARGAITVAEVNARRAGGRLAVAVIFAVAGWVTAIMLWLGWGTW